MPDHVEATVRAALAEVLPNEVAPDAIALDAQFDRLGLSSLNKVLFLTSVCERTGVGLHHFTEEDVAAMRTPGDVVAALTRFAEVG
jgi:acyl carrier protein